MILGIGTDIVENERIAQSISRSSGFKERVFSLPEIEYCESGPHPEERFAARFAAKEALAKALGTGLFGGLPMNQAGVDHDESGRPVFKFGPDAQIRIAEMGITRIHLSISHTEKFSTAVVVVENDI